MMGGHRPAPIPLEPRLLSRETNSADGLIFEELSLRTLPRPPRAMRGLAVPQKQSNRVGAVLALNGHGGSGEQVIRGQSLYWYGRRWPNSVTW